MTRIAVVQKDRCNHISCGDLCIKLCPVNREGEDCIILNPATQKAIIDEELCTGCGICVNRCPFDAIDILNLPSDLAKQPVHQYGLSEFHLFNLPFPQKGKVVGIIGINGIGKSTAIKIVAGTIRPNMAQFTEQVSNEQILEFFKGHAQQEYFQAVFTNQVKIAYKPQQVELLAKQSNDVVRQLLQKVDQRGKFEEYVNFLDLGKVLDRTLTQLSGGELQRVAICATALKQATVYIFDEPTSYLDIKQRLKLCQFIRTLATEEAGVLVIEHDLVALDYMADIIQIMYGKESVYGIVSQQRPAKAGINTYLEGFIKDENMRFRDHAITFDIKPPGESKSKHTLITWPTLKKTVGDFSLEIKPGKIHKNTIVGIVGENGIGKTTFAKILAGIEKPDEGSIDTPIRIAYKPQYLESEKEILVRVILEEAVAKHKTAIIIPLKLEHLLNKKINQLSGGELQRVAIAEALAKESDLILLDEPSAYLDVEQRLTVAKIIINLAGLRDISVIVIDHDLVFLDTLCRELMVFTGEPARQGHATSPLPMEQGMNQLLREVKITLRREEHNGRPRINKLGSSLDQEQKAAGKYYYQ